MYGKRVTNKNDYRKALEELGMNFIPIKKDIFYEVDDIGKIVIDSHKAVVNESYCLGVVGSRYTIIPYPEAFSLFEDAIASGDLDIVSGDLLRNGAIAFLILETRESETNSLFGGTIQSRFIMSSSHDGSKKLEVFSVPMLRTFKKNYALFAKVRPIRIIHKVNSLTRLARVKGTLAEIQNQFNQLVENFGQMATTVLEPDVVDKILSDLYGDSKRMESRVEDVKHRFYSGHILPGADKTAFGLYLAITESEDENAVNRVKKQKFQEDAHLYNAIFGTAAQKKIRAYTFLSSL